MYIREFSVKGYRRFLNRDIRILSVTFTEAMQLVLGSNGSGKSSLLELLGGMPPERKDFRVGGEVSLVIEHERAVYHINYRIGKSVVCDFKKDQEELNPGHTAKVQHELLLHHLQYSKEIHGLMNNVECFTRMTPARRREWFTRLSTVDMSYAIGAFNKARTNARDVKGAIRNVDLRIAQTEGKLTALALHEGTVQQIRTLTGKINQLLRMVDTGVPEVDVAANVLAEEASELNGLLIKAKALTPVYTDVNLTGYDDVGHLVTRYRTQQSANISTVETLSKEHYELERTLLQLQAYMKEDPNALGLRATLLATQIKALLPHDTFVWEGDITDVITDTNDCKHAFISFIGTVPGNVYPATTSQVYTETLTSNKTTREGLFKQNRELDQIAEDLRHINHTPGTACPKCEHVFHPTYTAGAIERMKLRTVALTESITLLETQETKEREVIDEWTVYIEAVSGFKEFKTKVYRLGELWETIGERKLLDVVPSTALSLFAVWHTAAVTHQDRHTKSCELKRINETLEHISALAGHTDTTYINSRSTEIDELIAGLRNDNRVLEKQCVSLLHLGRTITKYTELMDEIRRKARVMTTLQDTLTGSYINRHLNDAITVEHGKLAILQQQQHQYDSLQAVLVDLKESKTSLEVQAVNWRLILQALSPETGIIAKQIKGHIGLFVARMNAIISKIWTYDLTVMPCDAGSTDLDYRFPLAIPSKEFEARDVNMGSTGQKDIINFAFKIIAMEYLNLTDNPLFLDELGATFDSAHQNNLMQYLNHLLAVGRIKQMFVINHFNGMYGSLSNAEALVLDDDNIVLPESYNTHASFV